MKSQWPLSSSGRLNILHLNIVAIVPTIYYEAVPVLLLYTRDSVFHKSLHIVRIKKVRGNVKDVSKSTVVQGIDNYCLPFFFFFFIELYSLQ